jgi:hypothetical protein
MSTCTLDITSGNCGFVICSLRQVLHVTSNNEVEEDEMDGTCSTNGGAEERV